MVQDEFNNVAQEVSTRYTAYLEALRNAYNRSILTADLTARQLGIFKKEVANIQSRYLEQEVERLVTIHERLLDLVAQNTDHLPVKVVEDTEWTSYAYQNANFLYEVIKLQSSKDALYINNFLRAKVLQVMSLNDYATAYSLVFDGKDLSFFYVDSIGRKVNSQKYVRSIAREYMVGNYNDLIAGAAILNDVQEVTVENVDHNHRDHGKIISVIDKNEVNYFTIKADLFHANSNSILKVA